MPLVSLLLPLPALQDAPPRMTQQRVTRERAATIQGGGTLTVDGQALTFHANQLLLSPGNPKLGRAVKLTGTLTPKEGAPWAFDLQVTEKGTILLLQFYRKEKGQETGRWSPTLRSKVEVLDFHPEPGGTVRLKFSGPLSGILGITPKQSGWDGELWVSPR